MLNIILKLFYRFSKKKFGKTNYQIFFKEIHNICLQGMNFGFGGNIELSGEKNAIINISKKYKNNKVVIFDVGANKGDYSKLIINVFQNVDCYCFEPSVNTFTYLQKNLKDLQSVKLFNIGFGENSGNMILWSDKEFSGIASVYQRNLEHYGIEMKNFEKINIKTIDEFCIENNINHINLLKLDIEGHELSALNGATNMLNNKKINYIQFEFGGCNIDSRTYFQDFWYKLKDNYNIYRIIKNGLIPIKEYNESYEVFLTINYLAELK